MMDSQITELNGEFGMSGENAVRDKSKTLALRIIR